MSIILIALSGLTLALDTGKSKAPPPPADWTAWAIWAEKIYPITDQEGHGPDVGSDEWARALGKRLKISDDAGEGPKIRSKEWRRAIEARLQPKAAGSGVITPEKGK